MNGQILKIGEKYGTFTIINLEKDNKNKTIYVLKCDCGAERKAIGYYVRKCRKCRYCKANALIGTKNHKTTFLKYIRDSEYECLCDCGKHFIGKSRSKSCGCHIEEYHIAEAKKLDGENQHGLKVRFKRFEFIPSKRARQAIFEAKCKCGKLFEVNRGYLNKVKSCGCRQNCNYSQGENHYNSKLSEKEVLSIIELYLTGLYSLKEISDIINIDVAVIRDIIKRKSWKFLDIPKKLLKNSPVKDKIGTTIKYEKPKIGGTYGHWKVIEKAESRSARACYLCECKCKRRYSVYASALINGDSTKCRVCQKDWCKKYDYPSLVGQKIRSRTILSAFYDDKNKRWKGMTRCDCGHERQLKLLPLILNKSKFCEKCYPRSKRKKHV